jgi:hypothetical protein
MQPLQRKWTETANYWNFSKSKGHNSRKNGSMVPKTQLEIDIRTINLYTKFHFNMCNQCKENERKLQIIGIFGSPRNITLAKMARSYPKHVLTINLCTKFHFNMSTSAKENERKLQIIGIFQSPRAITLTKMVRSYPRHNLK